MSSEDTDSPVILVTIDPRVELVSIAQHLSGYVNNPRYQGRINGFSHPYIQAMKEHFAGYAGHDSLERLAKLRIGGSEPTNIAVHMSEPDAVALPAYTDKTELKAENAPDYVACLREFAEAASFMSYFETTKASRDAIVADFKKSVDLAKIAQAVEQYCGTKPSGYTIILAPLLGRTSFGPNAVGPDGRRVFYAIFPPAEVVDGHLRFGDPAILSSGVCHELSHSFINPLVDKHWRAFAGSALLMKQVRYARSSNYGEDWRICVYEHIVRAVTARIIRQQQGEAAYTQQIERDNARGFPFINAVCNSLSTYEQNRAVFPTLDSYFQELARVFQELQESSPATAPTRDAGP